MTDDAKSTTVPLHVLGLTDMRADEMADPFEALGERGTLVTVDPDEGIRGYLSAVRAGARCVEHRDSDAILAYNGSGLLGSVGTVLSSYYDVPLLVRQNGDVFRQHRETAREQVRDREWRSLAVHLPFLLLTRAIFRGADGFVPVADALTEVVGRQTTCPPGRIAAVPNPVSLAEYAPPEEEEENESALSEGNDGDATRRDGAATRRDRDATRPGKDATRRGEDADRRLLTVTNLHFRGKYEGVTELVDAVVPLLRRRDGLEYVVAGDGRYLEPLRRYLDAVASDVRDRIRAPGFVEDVATLYWSADAFLYASYIDGYPNVILEAQAAELPIVTNSAYGVAEQVEDGESGVFVDPSETAELARTISALLDDPDERTRLGRNARQRVESENSPEVVASRLYDTVRGIVNEQRERGAEPNAPTSEAPSGATFRSGRSAASGQSDATNVHEATEDVDER